MRATYVVMVGGEFVRRLHRDAIGNVYVITTTESARALRFASVSDARTYWHHNRPTRPPAVALLVPYQAPVGAAG